MLMILKNHFVLTKWKANNKYSCILHCVLLFMFLLFLLLTTQWSSSIAETGEPEDCLGLGGGILYRQK